MPLITPKQPESTPQSNLHPLLAHIVRHPKLLDKRIDPKHGLLQLGAAPVLASAYVARLSTHLGYAYRVGPSRCTGTSGYHDCSGMMCWGLDQMGIGLGCTSSFALAIYCHQRGLSISADECRSTPGTWAFRGMNEGQSTGGALNGSDGHIVCSTGDGHTIEAMGRAYGCVRGNFDGRGWSYYSKIPGVSYAPVQPPMEDDVIIVVCPNKTSPDGHNQPHAEFVPASAFFPVGAAILRFGASIANDLPTKDHGVRIWVPTARAPGRKWVSMGSNTAGNGLVFVDDHGETTYPGAGHWS